METLRRILLPLLVLLLAGAVTASAAAEGEPIHLTGTLAVAMGDGPSSPMPSPGDPAWRVQPLLPTGLGHPLPHREGIAWVTLDFTLEEGQIPPEPALLLSQPADATEASLNGTFLGREGTIAERYVAAPYGPLQLLIPPGVLHAGENRLVLRLLFTGKSARVLDAPFLLGREDVLQPLAEDLYHPILGMEAAYLALFAFLTLFYGFLLFQRVLRGEYIFFFLFTALYGISFFLGSNWVLKLGQPSPFATQLQMVLSSLLVMVMVSLVVSATNGRLNFVYYAVLAVAAAFTLAEVALPPLMSLTDLAFARKGFLLAVGVYYLWLGGSAVWSRRPESKAIFLGVAIYVAGSRLERFWGLNLQDLAMGGFAICMLFALTRRHARLKDRLAAISGKVLEAHEEERRRIARDLHDGMGQELLALRLQLQMLAAKGREGVPPLPEALDELAKKVLGMIEEVRRTALDLRLTHVESRGLLEAFRWYGATFSAQNGMEVVVHDPAEPVPEPGERIKDNLFRIFQESLNNVARHSGAGRVDVSLYRSGRTLFLQVADDGKGFDTEGPRGTGLGLGTMEERAELLNGRCTVQSSAGRGTVVTVEVPLR